MKRPILDQWERYEIRVGIQCSRRDRNLALLEFWKEWRKFKINVAMQLDKAIKILTKICNV